MENEALRKEVARELQALIILGRAIAPLQPEKNIKQILVHQEVLILEYLYLLKEAHLSVSASQLSLIILHIDKARVSFLLKRLRTEGYILRRLEGDRSPYRLILVLTEQGEEIARQVIDSDVGELSRVIEFLKHKSGSVFLGNFLQELREGIVSSLRTLLKRK